MEAAVKFGSLKAHVSAIRAVVKFVRKKYFLRNVKERYTEKCVLSGGWHSTDGGQLKRLVGSHVTAGSVVFCGTKFSSATV
jgi:hypothetical protein